MLPGVLADLSRRLTRSALASRVNYASPPFFRSSFLNYTSSFHSPPPPYPSPPFSSHFVFSLSFCMLGTIVPAGACPVIAAPQSQETNDTICKVKTVPPFSSLSPSLLIFLFQLSSL